MGNRSPSCPIATGVSNIFLYDLGEKAVYQLTDFYTGSQGITPLSPVLSWAAQADRLAFVYFEKGKYDVYTLSNPRSLKRQPYQRAGPGQQRPAGQHHTAHRPTPCARCRCRRSPGLRSAKGARSIALRSGFRSSSEVGRTGDTAFVAPPLSVAALLDSAAFSLPDTSEFTRQEVQGRFHARLRGAPFDRLFARQFRARILRRSRRFAQRHPGQPPADLCRLHQRTDQMKRRYWRRTPT